MVAIAVIGILAAVLVGVFGRTRATSQRARCDVQVKAIILALDAFRQERGFYPEFLNELVTRKYLTDPTLLRCPSDPRVDGSYNDFYIARAARDSDELPILVCPLCETPGETGIQAFKGRYTKQFAARPAEVTLAGGATILRPGKTSIAAKAGMLLRGGDTVRTAVGGQATLRFADGSVSEIGSGSEVTVLQSFIAGHTRAPLYTILRQNAGDVLYRVNPGSKFDVATPTATAGALGTEFQIREVIDASNIGHWSLKVIESKVYCSTEDGTKIYTPASGSVDLNDSEAEVTQTDEWIKTGPSEVVVLEPVEGSNQKPKKVKRRARYGSSHHGYDD